MKKIFSLVLILISLNGQAQFRSMFAKKPIINLENFDKKRVYYGYFLGFNSYDFKFSYKTVGPDVLVKKSVGFNVGLVGSLQLGEYFALRFEPGLYLNQRDLSFPGFSTHSESTREVKSTYVHFPLLLKFSSDRIGNVRPFILGGVATALNLSSNETVSDDNANGTFRMKKWTNFYEVGLGVDLYMEYFKFSPSVRGVFGIDDELIRDKNANSPWTGNVESMQTRGIFVNFTFH